MHSDINSVIENENKKVCLWNTDAPPPSIVLHFDLPQPHGKFNVM